MILIDSDVMVDIVRRYPPALEWLDSLGLADVTLPGFVVMELIEGCRNKQEQSRLDKIIEPYRIVWPTESTCDEALSMFADRYLKHGLGILDAVIGQTAVDLGVPLMTFNQKHYSSITGLRTVQPYSRK